MAPKYHTAITEHRQPRGEFRRVGQKFQICRDCLDRTTGKHSNRLAQQVRHTPAAPFGEVLTAEVVLSTVRLRQTAATSHRQDLRVPEAKTDARIL